MPSTEHRMQLPERYRIVRRVASGGMATVYAAEDGVLGRLVAVKVLAEHMAADHATRVRFEREARTAARVSDHPNVVTIYDVGEHAGNAFIVMELFTGGTVADRLRQDVPIPRPQAMHWLEQAAAALDHAHAEDIVHRDVKPANLLLDERGRLAVADFGIARMADQTGVTQVGQVIGTAAYLSPEQAVGDPATAASDRYALGVVAFELLTGHRPFSGPNAAAQAMQHVDSALPPTGLGRDVDAALTRMLAKDPQDRYPTGARFVEELRHAVGRDAEPVVPPTRRVAAQEPREPRPAAREASVATGTPHHRRGWPLVAALGAIALAVAAVALFGGDDPEQNRASEPTTQKRERPSGGVSQQQSSDGKQEQQQQAAPETQPESTPAPTENPVELNALGVQRLQAGDPAGAIEIFQRADQAYASQGDGADRLSWGYVLYNLGQAHEAAGDPAAAVAAYEKRLEVSPDDQRKTVEKALKRAQKAAGRAGYGGDQDWSEDDDE